MRTREGLSMCSGDSTLRRSEVSIRATIIENSNMYLPLMGKGDRVSGG